MTTFNISLNKELAQLVDNQVKLEKYANRSEFFRQLLRDVYVRKDKKDWIYKESYISKLKNRVSTLKSGKFKFTTLGEFDSE